MSVMRVPSIARAICCFAVLGAAGSMPNEIRAQRAAPKLPRAFRVEDAHSSATFSIGFLGFPVRGRFDDVRGTLSYMEGDLASSSISIVIPTKSITTGSEHRDEHLRSSDFFDAAKHPYIVFQSRRIERDGGGFLVTGPLTMHGVTRTVSIPFREAHAPVEEPHGSTLLFFSAALRLNRKDFGILGGSKFNDWFDEVRSAAMADSVDIAIDVQGWDPDYKRNTTYDRALARIGREGMDSLLNSLRATRAKSPDTLKDAEWELSQIGKALLVRGNGADALKLLRFQLELFPKSATARSILAGALEVVGQRDEARVMAQRALELDPYDTVAMELLRRM